MAAGPARGDLDHWRFDTVDLAPALRPGRNVVAAIVWHFGAHAPMAQVSHQPGFVLQGNGETERALNTGAEWKATVEPAWTPLPLDRARVFHQYFAAGAGERIDGTRRHWGWEQPDYDDSAWPAAEIIGIAAPRGARDSPSRWFLVPRNIPLMEETPERLTAVVRAEGADVPAGVLEGRAGWTIPANTRATALLDRGMLTTAYPEIVMHGGAGARVTVTYAEALYGRGADGRPEKGRRHEVAGKTIAGLQDVFLPDGGRDRLFAPLWWRTFRYVEVAVETGDEPLTIADIRARFTAYPAVATARFSSDDPLLQRIFEVGWRTVRLCSHETFMDTPYWEQLQYIGDTRIQALVMLYMTGDDRLVRNAIELFDQSRIPDGLTQSRYPTDLPQIIPPFSLFWIGMQHDLWWYGGDKEFARRFLDANRGVLSWFEARLAPSGLLGRMEWWNFADWIDGWPHGEPPQLEDGQSVILSLQFAIALREAAALEDAVGSVTVAARYRALAREIAAAARRLAWDEARGLLADTPAKDRFSQHASILAVLADVVPQDSQRELMIRVLEDPSLTLATYYFRFYLFRALGKAGLADRYLDQLGPWKTMLDLGLTTWAEKPEPTRSDSHAWSAHPTLDLLAIVAGITPATPGFGRVWVRPHLGHLTRLEAAVPTPRGEVSVSYRRTGDGLEATVTLPEGVTGTIAWGETVRSLESGRQTVLLR